MSPSEAITFSLYENVYVVITIQHRWVCMHKNPFGIKLTVGQLLSHMCTMTHTDSCYCM